MNVTKATSSRALLATALGALLLVGAGCFAKTDTSVNVNAGAGAGTNATVKTAAQVQAEAAAKAEAEAAAKAEAEAAAKAEAEAKLEAGVTVKKEWKVALSAQTSAAVAGTAVLTEVAGKTVVKLSVTGAGTGTVMPAHIHMGACPKPGDIKWNLNNVISGKSETTIDASIDQIKASLPLAINVHKSATELQTYMSCGDLKADALMEIKTDAGVNAGTTLK